MDTVNFLASVIGLTWIAVALSLLLNAKMMRELFMMMEKETMSYVKGIADFVFGVIVVLWTGNVWGSSWMTIITVIGWLGILGGIFMMFWPAKAVKWMMKMKDSAAMSYLLLVLVIVGLVLVYFGFAG
jgi:hypothetical protein